MDWNDCPQSQESARYGLRCRLRGLGRSNPHGDNHRHLPANEIGGERRQPVNTTLAGLNGHVAAHNTTAAKDLRLSSFEIS